MQEKAVGHENMTQQVLRNVILKHVEFSSGENLLVTIMKKHENV
jgi:hypothetical protein